MQKEEFYRDVSSQLEVMDGQIEEIRERFERLEGAQKTESEFTLGELLQKRETAWQKLHELEDAEENEDYFMREVDVAQQDLRISLESAMAALLEKQ